MPLTDEEAEAYRLALAQHAAEQAAADREAENARRSASRAKVEPLAAVAMAATMTAAVADLRNLISALGSDEWDLANLTRNAVMCMEGLAARVERRLADLEPVPEPEPVTPPPTE